MVNKQACEYIHKGATKYGASYQRVMAELERRIKSDPFNRQPRADLMLDCYSMLKGMTEEQYSKIASTKSFKQAEKLFA